MVEIETAISFDEYNAIIDKVTNDCFPNGTYSPANYDLSLRTALLCAFAPDFDLSDCNDNNTLWERVTSDEANKIISELHNTNCVHDLANRIRENIEYRVKLLTSGSMSMSDIALSKLFEVIIQKIESIDTSALTKDNMDTMIKAVNATQDGNFAESLVDTMLDKGLLAKPNRETRRKNGQRSKTTKTDIKLAPKSEEKESE